MEQAIQIAIDMYFDHCTKNQHRELGEHFLRSDNVLDNLMDVVAHVQYMEACDYANLDQYNPTGKLNYLQHLYVVFNELRRVALNKVEATISNLSDMFYRYHDKHENNSNSSFNYTFRIVFHTYFDNQKEENLPSALAKTHNLCKNQTFTQVLNSFLKQADTVMVNYSSLNIEHINKVLKDAIKINYAKSL